MSRSPSGSPSATWAASAQCLSARDLSSQKVGRAKYMPMCDHTGRLINDPVLLKLADDRYWFSIADSDILLRARAIAGERGYDVVINEPDVSPLAIPVPLAENVMVALLGESVRDLKLFWHAP
ncbi:MAG: glycine cleavage system aminomethyltransferase T [Candidatus Poriferisodalaceae bacterium]|jgi:glycine cleavage system aminomethyltransferase T